MGDSHSGFMAASPQPSGGGCSSCQASAPGRWPSTCQGSPCGFCDEVAQGCPKTDEFLVPPRLPWYVVTDGAAIRRNPSRDVDFASLNGPASIVLSTRDFNYDFRAAGHVLVGHTINECFQIEGVYLGVTEAENVAAVRDTSNNLLGGRGNLFSPFGGFGASPVTGLDFNNLAQIRYTSSLQGAELNVRRHVPMPPDRLTLSILFGVRYLDLPEDFQYLTQSDVGVVNSIHVTTHNQMVGPQIGALMEFYVDNRWWINLEGKAAVMNNHAQQSTAYRNVDNNGITHIYSGGEQGDHTAFAGDVELTCVYRWSPNITTRLGYRALMFQDVALAPNNFDTNINILTQGPAQLNHSTAVIYHGPHAGLEVAW